MVNKKCHFKAALLILHLYMRRKNQKDSGDFLLENELETPNLQFFDILERTKGHF